MDLQKRTITVNDLKSFKNHSKHFTTKVIEDGIKEQIRFDNLSEVLEVSKVARCGSAIWVWIRGMNPLQVVDPKTGKNI